MCSVFRRVADGTQFHLLTTVPSALTTWALTTCQQQEVLQYPRLSTFPSSPSHDAMWRWSFVVNRVSPPSSQFPIPVLLFTKPINTCNQLLSNDIWRMWQVNIFCHFTALLGELTDFAQGFLELYEEGSHRKPAVYILLLWIQSNKHRLFNPCHKRRRY